VHFSLSKLQFKKSQINFQTLQRVHFMDFTLPNDLDVDKLSFEEIKFILDNLKVRYSIRKDTTREYLALVLKRHLSVKSIIIINITRNREITWKFQPCLKEYEPALINNMNRIQFLRTTITYKSTKSIIIHFSLFVIKG